MMASNSTASAPEGETTADSWKYSTAPQTVHAEDWPGIIAYYRELLATTIRAGKFIFKMRLPNGSDEVERSMNLDFEDRCIEAAQVLFEYLLKSAAEGTEADRKSQWYLFDQVLKSDYPWLRDIILDVSTTDAVVLQQKQLIHFFQPEICEKVNPMHLLPHLVSENLLQQAECERLSRTCEQHGPSYGAMYMLSHIHRNTPDWYYKFIDALMKNEYGELVEQLVGKEMYEEKYLKGKDQKTPSTAGQCDHSSETETVMKVYGEAHVSRPPAYCPPDKSCDEMDNSGAVKSDTTHLKMNIEDEEDPTDRKSLLVSEAECSTLSCSSGETTNNFDDSVQHANKRESMIGKDLGTKNVEDIGDNSNAELERLGDADKTDEAGEPIVLRDYQEELAQRPLAGKNVIVCAPTGSGKTHVALKVIQSHLQEKGKGVRKVVFLVNQVALAEQQYRLCEKHLKPFRCHFLSGDLKNATKVPLDQLLMRTDVLVMTAQILLDALDQKEITDISEFSLLVFDECHHTGGRHPFNCIMHHYMALKYGAADDTDHSARLPQVLGLTASVGVGKAGNQKAAMDYIRKLLARLDAEYVCTVNQHAEQLAQFSNDPVYDLQTVQHRPNDEYQKKIEEIMREIEEKMEKSDHVRRIDADTGIKAKLKPPSRRGVDQYIIWVSQLRRPLEMLEDTPARMFLLSCRRQLEFYNKSIGINDECDTEDALDYLIGEFEKLYEIKAGSRVTDIDNYLRDLFDKNRPYLQLVSQRQANTNPKLNRLEEMLFRAFTEEPESRALIFVKTRDLASALEKWMKRRPKLRQLKPGKIVGAGPSTEKGGMTKSQQVDVMQYFRVGDHRVMVATSVAEEGLDIRKCNLVIRYDHVTNEIAMMQARGRARAENSKFVTLASQGRGVQEKEEINLIREIMMREAIRHLQREIDRQHSDFLKKLEEIQREEKNMRDIESAVRKGRRLHEGEVVLHCRMCDQFACMSSDIKIVEKSHHVIVNLDFREHTIEKPHPKAGFYATEMEKKSKMHCKKCGTDWGIVVRYRDTKFPVIKIESFIVVDEYGKRDAPKKWKNVSFMVDELTLPELEEYRRAALAAGYVFE